MKSSRTKCNIFLFLQTSETIGFADKQYFPKKSLDNFDSRLGDRPQKETNYN